MAKPTLASPITIRSDLSDTVKITDESAQAKTLVHADADPFDVPFGSSRPIDNVLICGTRPKEWLLIGSPNDVAAVIGRTRLAEHASTVDLSHGRALLRITGIAAKATLEKLCSLDWSDHMTPDGAVTSSSVAKVGCDIIRHDHDGVPSYLLSFDRSFGQYLYDAIADAAAEFGPKP